MNLIRTLLIAFSSAAFVWGLLGWLFTRQRLRSMTQIERANAAIDEAERKDNKVSLVQRLRDYTASVGYQGDLTPVLVGMTFIYLICTLGLVFLGFASWIGAILGLPLSFGAVMIAAKQIKTRRQRKFNEQLMQALTLLAAQVEAGNGPQLALDRIIPSLQDPIRSELTATMDATVASKNLVLAMKELESRYPSRPFQMFISALEIDEAKGGRLEPALRQAASALQREFDLSKEAIAEISQQKMEFLAIVGIISGIVVTVISSNPDAAAQAFLSPVGIIITLITLANAALGGYRALNIFRKAKGE